MAGIGNWFQCSSDWGNAGKNQSSFLHSCNNKSVNLQRKTLFTDFFLPMPNRLSSVNQCLLVATRKHKPVLLRSSFGLLTLFYIAKVRLMNLRPCAAKQCFQSQNNFEWLIFPVTGLWKTKFRKGNSFLYTDEEPCTCFKCEFIPWGCVYYLTW